jgi:hypothetical protein
MVGAKEKSACAPRLETGGAAGPAAANRRGDCSREPDRRLQAPSASGPFVWPEPTLGEQRRSARQAVISSAVAALGKVLSANRGQVGEALPNPPVRQLSSGELQIWSRGEAAVLAIAGVDRRQ